MKRRHLYVILAILALGLLAYAPTLLRKPGHQEPLPGVVLSLDSLQGQAPTRIRVTAGRDRDTVRLERLHGDPEQWLINGHPADSLKVAQLLGALDTMAVRVILARNPKNYERLGITDSASRHVEIASDSGRAVAFLLGTRRAATGGYPVRPSASTEVYLLPGPAGGYLNQTSGEWRDHTIARLDSSKVREIVIRRNGRRWVIRRQDGTWSVGGAAADSTEATLLLRRLTNLNASDFPPDSVVRATDFRAPDAILEVFAEDEGDVTGRKLVLSLRMVEGESDSSPWRIQREDGEVFELSSYTVKGLLKTPGELRARP